MNQAAPSQRPFRDIWAHLPWEVQPPANDKEQISELLQIVSALLRGGEPGDFCTPELYYPAARRGIELCETHGVEAPAWPDVAMSG